MWASLSRSPMPTSQSFDQLALDKDYLNQAYPKDTAGFEPARLSLPRDFPRVHDTLNREFNKLMLFRSFV